jgi:hypothetical protein
MSARGILLLLYSWLLSSVVLVTVLANDRSTIVVASLMFIAYDDDLMIYPSSCQGFVVAVVNGGGRYLGHSIQCLQQRAA